MSIASVTIGELQKMYLWCEISNQPLDFLQPPFSTSTNHYLFFNSYVSGDLLLGGFGESCDRNRNDCEVHLICDSSYGKDASAQYGTCLYPRFVKTGGICDLHYLGEACERGSYCWSDKHVVYSTKESRVVNDGSSGVIRVGNSQNPRLLLGTKIGECLRQVGAGNLCNSPFACIDGFTCIGAGGIEIGLDPNSSGSVSGPSGTVSWNVEVNDGICM
jgi:hypothetical protein